MLLESTKQTLNLLKEKYNKEYNEAIYDLNIYMQDMDTLANRPTKKYSEIEVQETIGQDVIIDYIKNIIDNEVTA